MFLALQSPNTFLRGTFLSSGRNWAAIAVWSRKRAISLKWDKIWDQVAARSLDYEMSGYCKSYSWY